MYGQIEHLVATILCVLTLHNLRSKALTELILTSYIMPLTIIQPELFLFV